MKITHWAIVSQFLWCRLRNVLCPFAYNSWFPSFTLRCPNLQLANQNPCLLSWFQVTDLKFPDFLADWGMVNTLVPFGMVDIRLVWHHRGYLGSTASHQNTSRGSTKLAWYAAKLYQKGMIGYKNYVCLIHKIDVLILFRFFIFQAIPDTKLTIKKYADAKFEYLVSLPTTKLLYIHVTKFITELLFVSITCIGQLHVCKFESEKK